MKILTPDIIKQIQDGYGTYQIFALSPDKTPIAIKRFATTDNTGLIYIGRAGKQQLRKRLSNFEMTHRQNSRTTNHSGALKYRTIPIIKEILDKHDLYFKCDFCENPELEEKKLLKQYRQTFGDTPLLNG